MKKKLLVLLAVLLVAFGMTGALTALAETPTYEAKAASARPSEIFFQIDPGTVYNKTSIKFTPSQASLWEQATAYAMTPAEAGEGNPTGTVQMLTYENILYLFLNLDAATCNLTTDYLSVEVSFGGKHKGWQGHLKGWYAGLGEATMNFGNTSIFACSGVDGGAGTYQVITTYELNSVPTLNDSATVKVTFKDVDADAAWNGAGKTITFDQTVTFKGTATAQEPAKATPADAELLAGRPLADTAWKDAAQDTNAVPLLKADETTESSGTLQFKAFKKSDNEGYLYFRYVVADSSLHAGDSLYLRISNGETVMEGTSYVEYNGRMDGEWYRNTAGDAVTGYTADFAGIVPGAGDNAVAYNGDKDCMSKRGAYGEAGEYVIIGFFNVKAELVEGAKFSVQFGYQDTETWADLNHASEMTLSYESTVTVVAGSSEPDPEPGIDDFVPSAAKAYKGSPKIDTTVEPQWDVIKEWIPLNKNIDMNKGNSPATVKFKMMWDEKGFYLLVVVEGDETLNGSGDGSANSPWSYDSLQISFDYENTTKPTDDGGRTGWTGKKGGYCVIDGGGEASQNMAGGNILGMPTNTMKARQTDDGYVFEAFIGWGKDMKMEQGASFGFDLYYNDNMTPAGSDTVDGTNLGRKSWSSESSNDYLYVNRMGDITLDVDEDIVFDDTIRPEEPTAGFTAAVSEIGYDSVKIGFNVQTGAVNYKIFFYTKNAAGAAEPWTYVRSDGPVVKGDADDYFGLEEETSYGVQVVGYDKNGAIVGATAIAEFTTTKYVKPGPDPTPGPDDGKEPDDGKGDKEEGKGGCGSATLGSLVGLGGLLMAAGALLAASKKRS